MILRLDFKPEGMKLLRVEIEAEDGFASRVQVRGDFFAHPEELFEEAEEALGGSPIAELPDRAFDLFSRPGLSLHGVDAAAIAATLRKALDANPLP